MDTKFYQVFMDEEKLKRLPPIDKKTEALLRVLANAMLDRIISDFNSDILNKNV